MINQHLFIFEFVSGGGYNQHDIPSSLFCEGFAMLRSTVEDFKKLGFKITTLIDERISYLSQYLNCDEVKIVKNYDDFLKRYIKCVKSSTCCFVIAPEFSKHLYNLTQIVKDYKKRLLSIDLDGVLLGTSKIETYKFFKDNKVNTPKSYKIPLKDDFFDVDFVIEKFNQLGRSIIIKPDDGAGSELIFRFEHKDQIKRFFNTLTENLDVNRNYLVQEYIKGDDLSISIINTTNPKKTKIMDQVILSINTQELQHVDTNKEFHYLGGFSPVDNYEVLRDKLVEILKFMDLTNFRGYFGIDFIKKADNSIYFIEINPRLTTSYIGIRNILDYNPLGLLLNQYNSKFEFTKSKPKKFSHFTRLELKYSGDKSLKNINNEIIPNLMGLVPEIITPPIALHSSKINKELTFSCFISTKEMNKNSSYKRISHILAIFNNYHFTLLK